MWSRVRKTGLLLFRKHSAKAAAGIAEPGQPERRTPSQSHCSCDTSQNDDYRTLSLSGHVGFGSLPDQLVKKSIKQGFCFNILCIGETGSGKSTLINSLFNTNFDDSVSTHFLPNVRLKAQTYELQESNVLLKLTIVNTVGFGDQINKEDRALSCTILHLQKIKEVLFLGHSLKTLDLLTMKSLDSKVNIIPIIGKADSISKTELQKFKKKIMSELVSNGIQIYQFPTEDETVSKINTIMNGHLPFAVVGSTEEVKIGNKLVRARQYPWGIVQVENENHCDFVKLREMLICTNMEDLREQTHARHYELYRRCRLEEMGFRDIGPENKPVRLPCSKSYADRESVCHSHASVESLQEAYEAKRHEFYLEMQRKEEEMRQRFVQRVKEKETILKEAEQQVQTKFEHRMLMHQEVKLKLEKKKKVLEDEIAMFIERKANAEFLQSQAAVSTPVSLKRDKDRKNSSFT
ncbi:septin-10 isoform X3 [Tyto alba]|uniref:septin-10 isoform X3 n=1 Tax=Tyto alba TaxID=56313 RepID=UPI001C67B051|nr:septin-10 isoform X3 [Tyto alba]